jgi:hypothetical protein
MVRATERGDDVKPAAGAKLMAAALSKSSFCFDPIIYVRLREYFTYNIIQCSR